MARALISPTIDEIQKSAANNNYSPALCISLYLLLGETYF